MEDLTIKNLDAKKIRLKFGDEAIVATRKKLNTKHVGAKRVRIRAVINGDKKEFCYFGRFKLPVKDKNKVRIKGNNGQWVEGKTINLLKPPTISSSTVRKPYSPNLQVEVINTPIRPDTLSVYNEKVLQHPRKIETSTKKI
jgi:hypothetical protein